MAGLRVLVAAVIVVVLAVEDGVLPCTLRSHKPNPPIAAMSGSSGTNDLTSVLPQQLQQQHTSGPFAENSISSNAHDSTSIPPHHHHHHPHAAASGDPSNSQLVSTDSGSLHSYVPFPPPLTHPPPFAVKQGIPGPVDQHYKNVFVHEMLKELGSPPTFPSLLQPLTIKPVPGIGLDQDIKTFVINEFLKDLITGSTPVVFEPLHPHPGPPSETLPTVPYSKFDRDEVLQLKELISILFSMPGSSSNVAAAAVVAPSPVVDYVPSTASHNTIPAEVPSTVLPATGPAAGVPSTFSTPAPVIAPNNVVSAAPVVPVIADSAPVASMAVNPAPPSPPSETNTAAPAQYAAQVPSAAPERGSIPVRNTAQDTVPLTPVTVPLQTPSS